MQIFLTIFWFFLVSFAISCVPQIPRSDASVLNLLRAVTEGNSNSLQSTASTTPSNSSASLTISYPLSQYVFLVSTAIPTLNPTVNQTVTSCSVTPSLPTGLTLNASTCTITGTPTAQTARASYTVTASSASGNATTSVSIRISNTSAIAVIGQAGSFITSNLGATADNTLNQPSSVRADSSGNLAVSDFGNRRILYYTQANISAGISPGIDIRATRVYGQQLSFTCSASFNDYTGTCTNGTANANNMASPQSVFLDNSGNIFAEAGNRVLVFSSNASLAATRVYGQLTSTNFTSSTANNGGTVTANTVSNVQQTALDSSGGLYLCDSSNNRVLYYPSGSTTASRVYGQPDFSSSTANNGGISANSLSNPTGVALDSNGNVYIADQNNNRILRYTGTDTNATTVYGQANFTTSATGVTATTLNTPWMLAIDRSDNLFVTDYGNRRVLVFPSGSTTAARVYGQGSFTCGLANTNGSCATTGVTANGLNNPRGVSVDAFGNVYIADTGNNRILIY
ncbi:MAG: putative Ig domain-containing protein [Leptospira sp.]|nr:putative Ig domain-containing protein [Leptospira sp.]